MTTTTTTTMTKQERSARMKRGREEAERLAAQQVSGVALTFVENSGIARVKCVPVGRLEQVAGWGVGATPVFDVFVFDDNITTSPEIGGPDGDLRLLPDLDRLTPWPPSPAGHGRPPTATPRTARSTPPASAPSRAA
jgi:glutamine synthetase